MRDESASATLKHQLDQLEEQGWRTLWTKRDTHHKVIRREAPVRLDSSLAAVEDGIDPQSPLLIHDRATHMQILTMDPSKIDVVALSPTKDAQEAAERLRIFLASIIAKLNDNGAIDGPWAQGITDSGVAFFRLMWNMMPELPEDEAQKRIDAMKGENESDEEYDAKRSERELKARDEYFLDYDQDCWQIQALTVGELAYSPLSDNPTLAVQKSVIPYVDNNIQGYLGDEKGKWLSLDDAGKIVWLGEPRSPSDRLSDPNAGQKTLTYFVRDAVDPKTKKRMITEFVCVGDNYGDAEKVNEYENPLGRCSFFPVASGGEVPLEKNPDHRYPSKMLAEIAMINQLNYLEKHVIALARRNSIRQPWVDISHLTPAGLDYLRSKGWTEGAPGADKLVFQLPEPTSNEISVFPSLSKWPDEVDEHLAMLIQWTKEELAAVRPNRLATGDYIAAKEAKTATMGLAGMQASALPYGADLAKKGAFIKSLCEAILHCIVEWDADSPPDMQKKYYVRGTGDEPVLTGTVEPGKTVYITADDITKYRHRITVETKNETLQEQLLNNQESRVAYDRGEKTWIEHLRDLGNNDPHQTARDLELDRIERERRPRADQIRLTAIETYVSAKTGLNVLLLSGGPPQPAQAGGGEQQQLPQPPQFGPMNGTAPMVPGAMGDSVGAM